MAIFYHSAVEVVILGSGSAFPEKERSARNPAGYAARLGKRFALLDLGFGNVRQLMRAGFDPAGLTDVFFSHRHPDHVGDLPALLFLLNYDVKPRSGRVRLWGPSGFKKFVKDLMKAHAPWLAPRGYRLEVLEIRPGADVERDEWRLQALAVPHTTTALALRLSYKGKAVVYSGDTSFSPELADFAAECDLFLLECTVTEGSGVPGHLTPRAALATLEASHCKKGVLTHLSPATRKILSKTKLPRGVSAAEDLRRYKI
jgi:ribonuclease BN (tRNA processing enzyme)